MSVQKPSVCVLHECSMCGLGVPHIVHVYCGCVFTVPVRFYSRTGFPRSPLPPRPEDAELEGFKVRMFVKTSGPHLKFSVNNCFTFVYTLLLDCRGRRVSAADARGR